MLSTNKLENTIVVCDPEGGIWWPNEEAESEINASSNPEAAAIAIAENEPMRGEWKQ